MWLFGFSTSPLLDYKLHKIRCFVWIWLHCILISYELHVLLGSFQHFLRPFVIDELFYKKTKLIKDLSKSARMKESLRMKVAPARWIFPKLRSDHDIYMISVFNSVNCHQKFFTLLMGHKRLSVTWTKLTFPNLFPITPCYGLNICIPPKFLHWSPNAQCDGIWRWNLWVVTRFRWCHQSGALMMGLMPL